MTKQKSNDVKVGGFDRGRIRARIPGCSEQ